MNISFLLNHCKYEEKKIKIAAISMQDGETSRPPAKRKALFCMRSSLFSEMTAGPKGRCGCNVGVQTCFKLREKYIFAKIYMPFEASSQERGK